LSGAVENSEDAHFRRMNLVDGDKRQRCERQLSRSVHAALTSPLWKSLKIRNATDDRRRNILCGTWTTRAM
jgi:hypothetical protein